MLIALIIAGFIMITLGVALLIVGEVPLFAGKRIPARRARLIGGLFVSFLPLGWLARQLSNLIFGPDAIDGPVILWSLFALCWLAVAVILFRVLVPKRERRQAAVSIRQDTYAEAETKEPAQDGMPWTEAAPEPVKPTVKKNASRPTREEKNPFDFS